MPRALCAARIGSPNLAEPTARADARRAMARKAHVLHRIAGMSPRSIQRTFLAVATMFSASTAVADRAPAAGAPRATPPMTAPAAPAAGAATRPVAPPPPAIQLVPIDLSTIAEACKPLAKQAMSPTPAAAVPARISLASCMVDHAIAPLALCDCADSVVAVDQAIAPAIAILDDVIEAGDPASQVIAEHAEGTLYTGLVTRLLATLPKLTGDAGETEVALRDLRKQTLDVQLAPWREAAMTAFQHVVDAAKAHPEVARNAQVATAIRDSQQRLAAEVANR